MNPAAAGDMVNGMEVALFWIFGATAVLGGLGLLFARKAVHAAVAMMMTMVSLGIIYVGQRAEFVGIIQIFVYSGAVMMLFLFVVMTIGVDASDSRLETLKGQRFWAYLLGAVFAVLAIFGLTRVDWPAGVGLEAAQAEGTVTALAREIFERQVFGFEILGALLVIAVMGAMVLAHRQRLTPKTSQRQMSQEKLRKGVWLAGKPNPGVYARHNAADTPALAPDGTPVEESVPRALVARGQVLSPAAYRLRGEEPPTPATREGDNDHDNDHDIAVTGPTDEEVER